MPTIFALTLGFAVVLGWLIVAREPTSPVGPALAWCSASVAVVNIDDAIAGPWAVGVWPVNLVGLFVLLLVFPEGPLRVDCGEACRGRTERRRRG